MNFNKVIDMLFNETTINQESIAEEIPNTSIRDFFYSMIQAFKPDEILKIFNNNNTNNSSLILLYKENQQTILQDKAFKPFPESMTDILNEAGLASLNYSIANYVTLTNPNDYRSLYLNEFKQMMFYPNQTNINLALELIENTTNKLFKCIENKHFFLCELYTPEYMLNDILNIGNCHEEKITIAQLMVIYFIYQYHISFNNFREKYQMLFDNPNGNAQAISNAKENFNRISYFQENFYSNFSLIDLYNKLFIRTQCDIPKLENALVLIMSSIGQFFPQYRVYKMNPYHDMHLGPNNQLLIEEMLKSMNAYSDWSNWCRLLYQNPYSITINTINYIVLGKCESEPFNYYDIDSFYDIFQSKYSLSTNTNSISPGSVNAITAFIKCLIVIYVFFNSDMKKYSFCLDEDQAKTQSNITQFVYKNIFI